MGKLYKFVPRAAKRSGKRLMNIGTPVKRPIVQRSLEQGADKPYKLNVIKGFDSNNIKPYRVELKLIITDKAFKSRINNILDSNKYYICYCFLKSLKNEQLNVQATVELKYGQNINEKVMLSVYTEGFYEEAGRFNLHNIEPQTIYFANEESINAFVTGFEQAFMPFIDNKYKDYLKLKARLLGRD